MISLALLNELDIFVQAVNILKNLEVTIRKVHIRYEDGQTNSSGYPFATGVTLETLSMKTTASTDDGQIKLKVNDFVTAKVGR